MNPLPLVACLTDFGLSDHYVGVIKGVMLTVMPELRIVDISHDIPPGDILRAAYTLMVSYAYFPEGTIFLVVVDPGVGGERKALLAKTEKYVFIGPDNGVLSFALGREKIEYIVELSNHRYFLYPPSQTFHGRDIFAPAAAYVAKGVKPLRFGPEVVPAQQLSFPDPVVEDNHIVGSVLTTDRFGNLITNISSQFVQQLLLEHQWAHTDKLLYIKNENPVTLDFQQVADYTITIGEWQIQGLKQSYSEAEPFGLMAIFGSSNLLEISLNRGHAESMLSIRPGDPVILTVEKPE